MYLLREVSMMILFFSLGLLAGSCCLCFVDRHPDMHRFVRGRSQCDHCLHSLRVWDLVPVFSYLALKGRCRYCACNFPLRYPLTELFMGLVFLYIYWLFGWSGRTGLLILMAVVLFVMALFDLKCRYVPDRFQAPFLVMAIAYRYFFLLDTDFALHFLAWLVLGGVYLTCWRYIGGADIKCLASLSIFFQPSLYSPLFILSALYGLAMTAFIKDRQLPFIPALLAAWLSLLAFI